MDIDTDMGIWRLFLSIFSSALDPRLRLLYNYFFFFGALMSWDGNGNGHEMGLQMEYEMVVLC